MKKIPQILIVFLTTFLLSGCFYYDKDFLRDSHIESPKNYNILDAEKEIDYPYEKIDLSLFHNKVTHIKRFWNREHKPNIFDGYGLGQELQFDENTYVFIDVIIEFYFSKKDNSPIYRFILKPLRWKTDAFILKDTINNLYPIAKIDLPIKRKTIFDNWIVDSIKLSAPIPKLENLSKYKHITTPWIYCKECFIYDTSTSFTYEEYNEIIKKLKKLPDGYPDGYIELHFLNFANDKLIIGMNEIKKALNHHEQIKNQDSIANNAYTEFIEQYKEISLEGQIENECLDEYLHTENRVTELSKSYLYNIIDNNREYFICRGNIINNYNPTYFKENYSELVELEKKLWNKTKHIKRYHDIYSYESQLESAKYDMEQAADFLVYAANELDRRNSKPNILDVMNFALNQTLQQQQQANRLLQDKTNQLIQQAKVNIEQKNRRIEQQKKEISLKARLQKEESIRRKKELEEIQRKEQELKAQLVREQKIKQIKDKELKAKLEREEKERLRKEKALQAKLEKQRKEAEYLALMKNSIKMKVINCYGEHHVMGYVPKTKEDKLINVSYIATCRPSPSLRVSGVFKNLQSNTGGCFGDTMEITKLDCAPEDYEVRVTGVSF